MMMYSLSFVVFSKGHKNKQQGSQKGAGKRILVTLIARSTVDLLSTFLPVEEMTSTLATRVHNSKLATMGRRGETVR